MIYKKISGFADEIDSNVKVQFEILNKLGIEFFEPRGVNEKNISELTDDEARELKELMDKYGIKVSSIGSPIGKVKISDDLEKHFELYKRVVSIAKILNTRYIRIFSFFHDGGEWTSEEREVVILTLQRMIDYAKENDIILLHENEKDIYGDIASRCVDLMSSLGCENFRAVFDPANFVQCGQDTIEAYNLMKKHIEYMHIKDARFADSNVVPSGFGDGNVEHILSELFKDGYDGFLSLEPHLGSFKGLENLEMGDIMNGLPESGEDTFVIAYNALLKVLERIGE